MPIAILSNDICREGTEGRIQSERLTRFRELLEAPTERVDFLLDLGLQADNRALGKEGVYCPTAVPVDIVLDGGGRSSWSTAHLGPLGVFVPLTAALGSIDFVKILRVFNVEFIGGYADDWTCQTL